MRQTFERALRQASSLAILVAILACGASGSQSAEEEEASQVRSELMSALEAHLEGGSTYGEGPGGEVLAAAVRRTLAPDDGVAVRVTPGAPQNLVVLVRYRAGSEYEDLRDIPQSERNEEIDRIVDAIDRRYGAEGENLAVAIRGGFFYGAVGIRMAGQEMQYHTGSVVNLAPIDPLLSAPTGVDAPLPALTLSENVSGTVGPADARSPVYSFTLEEDSVVIAQLIANEDEDTGRAAYAVLCAGVVRPAVCEYLEDNPLEPFDTLSDDQRGLSAGQRLHGDVYRLSAGTYTVIVETACTEGDPCPGVGSPYTLLVSTATAR